MWRKNSQQLSVKSKHGMYVRPINKLVLLEGVNLD